MLSGEIYAGLGVSSGSSDSMALLEALKVACQQLAQDEAAATAPTSESKLQRTRSGGEQPACASSGGQCLQEPHSNCHSTPGVHPTCPHQPDLCKQLCAVYSVFITDRHVLFVSAQRMLPVSCCFCWLSIVQHSVLLDLHLRYQHSSNPTDMRGA